LFDMMRAILLRKDNCAMQVASELVSLQKLWRNLLALGAISVLIGGAAHAQNLDQGKPAAKLFADGCATCHRSARGLAKGRFSLTLFLFLQQHYASNSSSAWALTSYLESVESAQRGRSRAAAAKPSPPATRTSRSPIRPPAAVPGQ
jgi:mono/diheme cytochrome c family protein